MNGQSNGFHVQEMPSLIVFMEAADDVDQKAVRTKTRSGKGCHFSLRFNRVRGTRFFPYQARGASF